MFILRQLPLITTKDQQETILLASASPRRSELLNQIKVRHQVINVPSGPGEDEPRLAGEPPLDYVMRTARDKSDRANQWLLSAGSKQALRDVAGLADMKHAPPFILTADTTVCIDHEILGKPQDNKHAREILGKLSGRTHLVHTAVVLSRGAQNWSAISTTEVIFDTLSDEDIDHYIQSGEPFGKAGAYGIQGLAASFIKRINGSYSGVMGLPLHETSELMKQAHARTQCSE